MAIKKKGINTAEYARNVALPICEKLGLKLWDVTFTKEGTLWFLRVFIDKEDGVNIDDCVDVTHEMNAILDKEDPIPQEYTFEVSSCGLCRKLTKKEHFEAFLDQPIKVKLIRPLESGQREIEGILIDVLENGDFEIAIDEENTAVFTKKECSSVNAIDDI